MWHALSSALAFWDFLRISPLFLLFLSLLRHFLYPTPAQNKRAHNQSSAAKKYGAMVMASRENMEAAWREHALWSDIFWRDIELVWRSIFLPVLSLFCRLCPKKYHSKCPRLTTKLKHLILWKDTVCALIREKVCQDSELTYVSLINSFFALNFRLTATPKYLRQWNPHLSWNFIAV